MEQENTLDAYRLLVSAAAGSTNIIFYVLLMCCQHLRTTYHWALCNVAVSEATRAVVCILMVIVRRSVISNVQMMIGRFPPNETIAFNQPYHMAKMYLEVAEVSTTIITLIFGLVAIAHLYGSLGAIDRAQPRFGRSTAILSGLIWVAGVSYFIMQLYLILQSTDVKVDAFPLMVRYFSVVDLVMTFAWLLCAVVLGVLFLLRLIKGSRQSADPVRAAVVSLCDQPETIKARNRRWRLRNLGLLAVLVGLVWVMSLHAAENIFELIFHFKLQQINFFSYASISKLIRKARMFSLSILSIVLPFTWMLLDRHMYPLLATAGRLTRRMFDGRNAHRWGFYPHIQSHIGDNESKNVEQKEYFKSPE
uniref:G-protein coupled receptors family 1 profile domain-containing protein n=1 Tax=Plectus sambesii TaxID=2011161 RepID=A0A914ULS0_9BILA